MEAQQWSVYALPKDSIRPYPNNSEDYKKIELERLVKETDTLVRSCRLYFQPGSIVRFFNNERKIAKLNPQRQPPSFKDWMYGVSMEIIRGGFYAAPLVATGIKLYQVYAGDQ